MLSTQFVGERTLEKPYFLSDFAKFFRLNPQDALQLILDLEVFDMVEYNRFDNHFMIKPWAFDFLDASKEEFDYDSFKIQTIARVGDTIAEMDFILNQLDVFSVLVQTSHKKDTKHPEQQTNFSDLA